MKVEIDTLWNVKMTDKEIEVVRRHVEIDTLWNVKVNSSIPFCCVNTVEIDTLWNVKLAGVARIIKLSA